MSLNTRNCTQIGHEKFLLTHLCLAKNCKSQKKRCCVQCITQEIHNHDKQDLTHYLLWQDAIALKKEKLIKIQQEHQKNYVKSRNQLFQKGILQCKQIFKILQEYQQFFESQINENQHDKQTLQSIIQDLCEEKFIELDDKRITEIFSFKKSKYNNNIQQLIMPLENIGGKIIHLQALIKDLLENWNKINTLFDISQLKYQVKLIDWTQTHYNSSQISNNEQLLAYGGDDSILKIYDIKQERIVKDIKVDSYIYACQFTFDSSLLFVGSYTGFVFGYDILNSYKQIFGQQIHQDQVCNMRTKLNQYLITCSIDRSIIKTDIKTKQQVLKYLPHNEHIFAIDYNDIDDMIISGSHDKSIILWDCKSQTTVINKEKSHPQKVRQIQLINHNQDLLSLDSNNNLYKWKIDLIKKDLIKLQELNDPNKINNFYQINYDQNLLLICKKYIKIIDIKGNTINLIEHQAKDFDSWMSECRQLDNGNYIHIRSNRKLFLAKALNLKPEV